jgi:hypothetical protein
MIITISLSLIVLMSNHLSNDKILNDSDYDIIIFTVILFVRVNF